MRKLLPRVARLGHVLSVNLQAPFNIQIWSKNARDSASLRSVLTHVLYFRFNLRSNLEQKCESFCLASLGSAMCFIFASISVQIWSKRARASSPLRSNRVFFKNRKINFRILFLYFEKKMNGEIVLLSLFNINCFSVLTFFFNVFGDKNCWKKNDEKKFQMTNFFQCDFVK